MTSKRNKDGRHPFKWLTCIGNKVRIDADIAPLLQNMWKLDILTTNSCQSQCSFLCNHKVKIHPKKNGTQFFETIKSKDCGNNIWLVFASTSDLESFLNIIVPISENDPMYKLINCMDHSSFVVKGRKGLKKDTWSFLFCLENYGTIGHWWRPTINGKRSTQEEWIQDKIEKNDFIVTPQLTFPRKHLSYVEKKIQLAVDNI